MKNGSIIAFVLFALILGASCSKRELNTKTSNATAWSYFDAKTSNFNDILTEGTGNVAPVGMVAIQGGTFTMGENNEFLTAPRNTFRRAVSVNSFYMDKYEISNLNWREYEYWTRLVFGLCRPDLVKAILPDSTVWRDELAYNEPYELYYYRHPAFSFYPVVGVSWDQCMDYCKWRTDRVNEMYLVRSGNIEWPMFDELAPIEEDEEKDRWEMDHPGYEMVETYENRPNAETGEIDEVTVYHVPYEWIRDQFVFNTEKYLYDKQYRVNWGKKPVLDIYGNERRVDLTDGILVVGYRLPTEAEWEFAAMGPVAAEDGLTDEGKVYPWSGYHPRGLTDKKTRGQMQANFVRGRGDMMGVSGSLNDHYMITAPVDEYQPNDFGLYNMAGNVNEWVLDVYRETTSQEATEYNSFRGNIYTTPIKNGEDLDSNQAMDELAMEYAIDDYGRVKTKFNAQEDDKRSYKDGDFAYILETQYVLDSTDVAYLIEGGIKYDPTDVLAPRVTKNTRVYKGGSWKDRVYWLNPSARRYMDQNQCSNTLGFRCAMSTVGNQIDTQSPTAK